MKNLTKDQRKQIAQVIALLPKSSMIPALEMGCFNEGNLSFTDLVYSVTFKNIGIDGSFLIDAKDLSKVIKVSDGNTTFKRNSDEAVEFKVGKTVYRMPVEAIDSFPKIPTAEIEQFKGLGKLTSRDRELIQLASKAVSNDELRPVLQQVCIGDSEIVATDAHMMYFDKMDYPGPRVLIPPTVVKLLKIFGDRTLAMSKITASHITFEDDFVCITMREEDSKYPDYKAIIPQNMDNYFIVSRAEVNKVAKSAQDFFSTSWVSSLKFDLNGKAIVSGTDLNYDKEISMELEVYDKSGTDIEIGFSAKLLQKALSFINIDEVSIKYTEPNRAVVMNGTVLLMPVRLKDNY